MPPRSTRGRAAVNIRTVALVAAAAAAFAGLAQPGVAADLAKAQAGPYALDKSHAKVVFSINHLGFSTYYGFFTDLAGSLDLVPATPPTRALSITLNIKQMVTTD